MLNRTYTGVGSPRVSKGFFTNTKPLLTRGLLTQQYSGKATTLPVRGGIVLRHRE